MRGAILALLALVPALAHANAGIGYFMLALPIAVVALAPAVFVEAAILQPMFKVAYRRALSLSWWANLRSTLWGIGIGVVVDATLIAATGSAGPDPTRGAAIVMLVPLFFLSWSIEARAVRRLAPEFAPRVRLGTGIANAVTYAGMFAAAWLVYPEYGYTAARAQITEALVQTEAARQSVSGFWLEHERLPKTAQEARIASVASPRFRLTVAGEGRIDVEILGGHPALVGKRATMSVRAAQKGKPLEWVCSAPDIEARYLPAGCRQR